MADVEKEKNGKPERPRFTVSGYVFVDDDNDKVWDDKELPYKAGATIKFGQQGKQDTDSDGYYEFEPLVVARGTSALTIVPPQGSKSPPRVPTSLVWVPRGQWGRTSG